MFNNLHEHWQKSDTTKNWASHNGSEEKPYGDIFRVALINPVVLSFLNKIKSLKDSGLSDQKPIKLPLYEGVSDYYRTSLGNYDQDTILNWHQNNFSENVFKGLKVLDLGCGEGYIGRCLTRMGATYIGVDLPPSPATLLEIAKKRFNDDVEKGLIQKNQFKLIPHNLDEGFDPKTLDEEIGAEGPDLVIMSILLDHLSNPAPLMSWLGSLGSIYSKKPNILAWTLNPSYYNTNMNDEALPPPIKGGTVYRRNSTEIRDAELDTPIIFRCPLSYESIFTDSNLHVYQYCPIKFHKIPDRFHLESEDTFNDGESPFIAWHLYQAAENINSATRVFLETLSSEPDCLLSQLNEAGKELLLRNPTALKVEEYLAKSLVIAPHNLGGDLKIILEGSAKLVIRGSTKRSFSSFDLLGDLETSSNNHHKRFLFPVEAGDQKLKVINIPRSLTIELLNNSNSLGDLFFTQLRDRFYSQLWIYELRHVNASRGTVFGEINRGDLNRICRGILYFTNLETETFNRDIGKPVSFFNIQDIYNLVNEDADESNTKRKSDPVFSFLVNIGAIDSFHPLDIYKLDDDVDVSSSINDQDIQSSNYARVIWNKILLESAKVFLGGDYNKLEENDKKSIHETITQNFNLSKGISHSNSYIINNCKKAYRGSGGFFEKAISYQISENNLDSWFKYICKAHYFFFKNYRHTIIFINDELLLRSIALDSDEWVDQLLAARLTIESTDSRNIKRMNIRKNLWNDADFSRRKHYLENLLTFIKSDLASGARLHFSGHMKTNSEGDNTMLNESFNITP